MQTSQVKSSETFQQGRGVQNRYGISHVTLWRWVNDPALGFPKPLKINRLNYWRTADLEAWEASRMKGAGE